jgi:hypothetical protein
LVQDDPETIPSENSGPSCSFNVSFKAGVYYEENPAYPNGATYVERTHPRFGQRRFYGVGFTVSGTVTGGEGIGFIGAEKNPENPNGKWHLDQWTSSYAKQDGKIC